MNKSSNFNKLQIQNQDIVSEIHQLIYFRHSFNIFKYIIQNQLYYIYSFKHIILEINCPSKSLYKGQQYYILFPSYKFYYTILIIIINMIYIPSYPIFSQSEIHQVVPFQNPSRINYCYIVAYPNYQNPQGYNFYNQNCPHFHEVLQNSKAQIDENTVRCVEQENMEAEKSQGSESSQKKIENNVFINSEKQDFKPNIRNIIPNICKQLLKYLSSKQNQEMIKTIRPEMTQQEFINFYSYVDSLKKQNNLYIGKKDLIRIWFKPSKSPKKLIFQKIIRTLSFNFLAKGSINSILLSKKMKSSLKAIHLQYRRKLLLTLMNGKRYP